MSFLNLKLIDTQEIILQNLLSIFKSKFVLLLPNKEFLYKLNTKSAMIGYINFTVYKYVSNICLRVLWHQVAVIISLISYVINDNRNLLFVASFLLQHVFFKKKRLDLG